LASERSFRDALPERLYPDTDFLLSILFNSQPHHLRSLAFVDHLLRSDRTTLVVSSILWTEFAHVLSRESFRKQLAVEEAREVAPAQWSRPAVRERYIRRHVAELDHLLNQFALIEAPLDAAIRRAALALMARHALGSQDSVHVATAFAAGTRDLVSFDATYRRVDGLLLWNDHAAAGDAS
jgi:predicted nucleic acid-binding protein